MIAERYPSRLWSVLNSSLLILCLVLSTSVARAADDVAVATACHAALVKAARQELKTQIRKQWFFKRSHYLKKFKELRPAMERELVKACPNPDACSVDELKTVVANAIEIAMKKHGDWIAPYRGYAIILGTIVANAIMNAALMNFLPRDVAIITSSSLTVLTASVVTSMAAPVVEPLSAWVKKWSYGNRDNDDRSKNSGAKDFEEVYRHAQESLSNLGQLGRAIHRYPLNQIQTIFSASLQISTINREEGLKASAGMIAQLALDISNTYPEVRLTDDVFGNYTHAIFADRFITKENFPSFLDDVMTRMEGMDPNLLKLPEKRAMYQRMITSWVAPRPISLQSSR